MEFLKLLYPEASATEIEEMAIAIVKNAPEFSGGVPSPDTDPEAVVEIDPADAGDVIAEYIDGIVQGELITASLRDIRKEAVSKAREIVGKRKAKRQAKRAERKAEKQKPRAKAQTKVKARAKKA